MLLNYPIFMECLIGVMGFTKEHLQYCSQNTTNLIYTALCFKISTVLSEAQIKTIKDLAYCHILSEERPGASHQQDKALHLTSNSHLQFSRFNSRWWQNLLQANFVSMAEYF